MRRCSVVMCQAHPVTGRQRSLLTKRLRGLPELAPLAERLLSVGGEMIVPRPEDDLEEIMSWGRLWEGAEATLERGRPSRCHSNVAELWGREEPRFEVATGWALSGDGLWRQHTWGLRDDRVVETTEPRVKYYGFVLTHDEAERFEAENCW